MLKDVYILYLYIKVETPSVIDENKMVILGVLFMEKRKFAS